MAINKELIKLRLDSGLTMDELKKIFNEQYGLNVSKSMISRWENGKAEPSNPYLSAYAKTFNVSLDKLLNIDLSKINGLTVLDKMKKIPILGTIACGEPIWAEQNYDGYFSVDSKLIGNADFCLTAKGDSMVEAEIYNGDIVFLKKTLAVDNGKIAAILIDDSATLKKVFSTEAGVLLQPCNSKYETLLVNEAIVLGECVGVYHSMI